MRRRKIAICHPELKEGGGSEARPLWIATALKKDYDVTLVTMGRVDLKRLNHAYETHLDRDDIDIIELPIPFIFKDRFDALRGYRLVRFCREKSPEYDLMISSYNIMDFGRRGIQFIADFSFDDRLRRCFDSSQVGLKSLLYRKSPVRTLYLTFGKVLAGTHRAKMGWKDNLTITNSAWSGKNMEEFYGIDTQTIYPPVTGEFPGISWQDREDGFVCLGRLVPEKRVDMLVRILQEVRKKGHNIHLHIIGKIASSNYVKYLKYFAQDNSSWVFMEGGMFGKKKNELIAKHKFGIHGRRKEPFGIAVAEMVKAGCITFVPDDGGQAEIVNHPSLFYHSNEDAVDKIEKILASKEMQRELRTHLDLQAKNFTTDYFVEEIKHLAHNWFSEHGK